MDSDSEPDPEEETEAEMDASTEPEVDAETEPEMEILAQDSRSEAAAKNPVKPRVACSYCGDTFRYSKDFLRLNHSYLEPTFEIGLHVNVRSTYSALNELALPYGPHLE